MISINYLIKAITIPILVLFLETGAKGIDDESGQTTNTANNLQALLDAKPFRLSLAAESSASRIFQFTARFEVESSARSTQLTEFSPTLIDVSGQTDHAAILISTTDGLPFCLLVNQLGVICDPLNPGGLAYYAEGYPRWRLSPGLGDKFVNFELAFNAAASEPNIDLNLGGIIQRVISKEASVTYNEGDRVWRLLWDEKRSSLELTMPKMTNDNSFSLEKILLSSQNSSLIISNISLDSRSFEGLFDITLGDLKELGLPMRVLATTELRTISPVIPKNFPRIKEKEAAQKLQKWIEQRRRIVKPQAIKRSAVLNFSRVKEQASAGEAWAQYNLWVIYSKGEGVPQDFQEAAAWLRKSAEQNYTEAQFNLGVCYSRGQGVSQDFFEAVKWYRKAAAQSHPEATVNLGVMYFRGRGVKQDDEEALIWFRKGAELGSPTGICYVGLMHANGRGTAQDLNEAMKWYQKAAEGGNAWAQTILGKQYERGMGLNMDIEESLRLYKKAAEQGYPPAISALALRYVAGKGVEKNYQEAARLFQTAAKRGLAEAQYGLAILYKLGNGVPQDFDEARKWLERAANQGYSKAQLHLGIMLMERKENINAYKWLLLASNEGEKQSEQFLLKISKDLSAEEMTEGREKADAFVPQVVFDITIPDQTP